MAIRSNPGALIGTVLVAAAGFLIGTSCTRRIDVAAVRSALAADSRGVFDLVATLQGLGGDGTPDWGRAEQLCRGLAWPRCDRQALEEMRRRGRLPAGANKNPVPAAAQAVADVTWAFGGEDAARRMFRVELDRLPETNDAARGRVFLRFAIIDTNFDGQAALFAQACAADQHLCDREQMKGATEREVKARLVAPGNAMPLFFAGHPRLAGPK